MSNKQGLGEMVRTQLEKQYALKKEELGADARLSGKGIVFETESYEIPDLGHFCILRMNAFLGLMKIVKPANLKKMPSHLPVLFISGDRDPVGNMGRGVEQTAELFRKNGMENVTVRLYPGDRHEILQENNRQEVFGDVFLWIEDQGILS